MQVQQLHPKGGELIFDEARASGELCEMARQGNVGLLNLDFGCKVDAVHGLRS